MFRWQKHKKQNKKRKQQTNKQKPKQNKIKKHKQKTNQRFLEQTILYIKGGQPTARRSHATRE